MTPSQGNELMNNENKKNDRTKWCFLKVKRGTEQKQLSITVALCRDNRRRGRGKDMDEHPIEILFSFGINRSFV